jgi:hypoxanthine-DNA glycosylase
MPGVTSLEMGQYYAYRHNKFWPVMGELLGFDAGMDYDKRCDAVARRGVALWDVLDCCLREGSLDSNIEHEQPNDIASFINTHKKLKAVFFNGSNAEKFFKKYITRNFESFQGIHFERLPSTSPANASMNFKQKLQAWHAILAYLN